MMANERILVVDDESASRTMLTTFLRKEFYEVKAARDGKEALDILRVEKFDLILLDYQMPNLDGVEVLREMQRSGIRCPVIMMTSYATMEIGSKAIQLGAYDFIPKPIKILDMGKKVRICLDSHKQAANALQEPAFEELAFVATPPKTKPQLVAETGRGAGSEMILGSTLNMVMKWAGEAVRADGGEIFLLDSQSKRMFQRAACGNMPEKGSAESIEIGEGPPGQAVQKNDGLFSPYKMCVPLKVKNSDPLGAIHVSRGLSGDPFTKQDFLVLSKMAENVVIAVQNMRAYADLEMSKEYFKNIIHSMMDALLVINPRGAIVGMNRAAEELLSYSFKDLYGKHVQTLLDGKSKAAKWMSETLKESVIRNQHLDLVTKDQKTIPVVANGSCMRDQNGALVAIILVSRTTC